MSFFVAGLSCQAIDPYAIGRQTCEKHTGRVNACSSLVRLLRWKRLTLVLDIRLLESMARQIVSSEELLPPPARDPMSGFSALRTHNRFGDITSGLGD